MTFLSRLTLNPRNRAVRKDMADCQQMHRTVLSGFPQAPDGQSAREHFQVLYRLDMSTGSVPVILVQSAVEPKWVDLDDTYLCAAPLCKPLDPMFQSIDGGMMLRFRLCANPTRRISDRASDDVHWRGKRVHLLTEDAQTAWLARKAEQGGFELESVRTAPGVVDMRTTPHLKRTGRRMQPGGDAQVMIFGGVTFDGRLRIVDVVRFAETFKTGIGSGKAYGFGLLSIGPA